MLTWKLREHDIVVVVRHRAANAQIVFAGRIEMEIEFSNKGAIVAVARRIETETAEVQAAILTVCGIIAHRVSVQHGHHVRIHTGIQRIHAFHFSRRERLNRTVVQLEFQNSLAQRVRWNHARL